MISNYGIRNTYLFFSYLTGGTALIYFTVYHLFLKKIRKERGLLRKKGGSSYYVENSFYY